MEAIFITDVNLKNGLGIPYPKNTSFESSNIGYADLKKFPEKIDELPELKEWDELKSLIKSINNIENIFRTLRCDVSQSKDRKVDFKVTSYVTLAFEILDWNVKENFKELFKDFSKFSKSVQPSKLTVVEFELIPTSYNDHSYNAWSIDIWNHGFGMSERFARSNWSKGIEILKAFFYDQNSKYGKELRKDRKTIGQIFD